MKIAHIVCSYPPYYGGMGNVVFETASRLTQLGHEVVVYTPQLEEPTEEVIEYARRLKPSIHYGNAARLPTIERELDTFDIVHLHYPFFGTANLVRRWKLRHPEKPFVITYHMDTRGPGWKGLVFKLYAGYWMPKILGVADRLIVSSFDFLEHSQAASLYREQRDRWVELPFGVDLERFKPIEKPKHLFEEYNLNPDIPTIIFVGGMDAAHYFKGIPILLQSLFLLKRDGVNAQCLLVGDGELRQSFELQAQGLGISGMVRFAGRVSHDRLPLHYSLADLLVLPSTTQGEAFGVVILEAMASGVPVIATDLPGVRTIARDAGFVVPPSDPISLAQAIAGYLSGENDREVWKMSARHVAEEEYAWGPIVEKLEGVYNKLTS